MRLFLNSASAAVLALTLTACSSLPEAMAPSEVPGAFTAPQSADAVDAMPSADWWKNFNSEELTGLVTAARQDNLDLAIYAARVEQMRAKTGIAWADIFPTVSAEGTAKRSATSSSVSGKRKETATNSFGAELTASYELDFWGKNREYISAARNNARAAIFARDVEWLTVSADVANAYFAVLAYRDRLNIAKKNVEAAGRIMAITEAKVKNGASSNLELAQQTATLRSTEATIPQYEEYEREALYALAILLGKAPEGFDVKGQSLDGLMAPPIKPGLPSDILARRPDIAEAEADLKASHANLNAARLAFLPTISLTGTGGYASTDFSKLISPENLAWTAGATVLQAIFDGGTLTSTRDYYKALEVEQVATYRSTVLTALSDVETALGSTSSLAERERLIADQVKNAKEAFRISELQYREGVTDLLTVLGTEQTLFTAQDTLAQIRLARLESVVGLYRVLGGGWSSEAASEEPTRNTFNPTPLPF
jgi:outer membrane protein, multidrug efflux system